MSCDHCGSAMVNVGREIKPGHPEIWMDAWVCPTTDCKGHGVTAHDGRRRQWPAHTLMGVGVDLCISGAMKFKAAR